jgi:cutinase
MQSQPKACPEQKYVLVGYSQGADVTRGAAVKLKPEIFPRIIAVVMFGDPGNKGPGTPASIS